MLCSLLFALNLYANIYMVIQNKRKREQFSRQRQSLTRLLKEMEELVKPYFSDQPLIKGTVYELRRTCGKAGCRCNRGELHARMVLSASEGGKTRLRVIPRGKLGEVQEKVTRYREVRRARARLVALQERMCELLDAMEGLRREDLPAPSPKTAVGKRKE